MRQHNSMHRTVSEDLASPERSSRITLQTSSVRGSRSAAIPTRQRAARSANSCEYRASRQHIDEILGSLPGSLMASPRRHMPTKKAGLSVPSGPRATLSIVACVSITAITLPGANTPFGNTTAHGSYDVVFHNRRVALRKSAAIRKKVFDGVAGIGILKGIFSW